MKIIISNISDLLPNKVLREKILIKFQIVDSIMKEDFKSLMRLSHLYNKLEKSGYIKKEDETKFKELIEKIENSNSVKCERSHRRSLEKKLNKKPTPKKTYSFEEYCEDFFDQDIHLMSDSQKKIAFESFKNIKG